MSTDHTCSRVSVRASDRMVPFPRLSLPSRAYYLCQLDVPRPFRSTIVPFPSPCVTTHQALLVYATLCSLLCLITLYNASPTPWSPMASLAISLILSCDSEPPDSEDRILLSDSKFSVLCHHMGAFLVLHSISGPPFLSSVDVHHMLPATSHSDSHSWVTNRH